MITIILLLHLLSAATLIVSSLWLVIEALRITRAPLVRRASLYSFGSTFISGTLLSVVAHMEMRQFCLTMSALTLATLSTQLLYIKRTRRVALSA